MKWCFVFIETVLKITIQRPTCKTSIRPSSIQRDEKPLTAMKVKEHGYLQVRLETYLLHYAVKKLQHF